jgi:glycosyltransferase involved in cell wall biosynthesis
MRILQLTAGAGGMYCGSCLRDNALAAELLARGHDVSLLPVYTPTRTDEANVSDERVFFGGISVYLQQHVGFFRRTPAVLDFLWDLPAVIRAATGRGVSVDPRALGELTVSTLRGEEGFQAKEVRKLVRYLSAQPPFELAVLPVALLISLAAPLRRALNAPIVCTLQGDDLFLDGLGEDHREQCKALIRAQEPHVDAFVATSDYYADYMAGYLGLPRTKLHTVPVGINLEGHDPAPREGPLVPGSEAQRGFTLGYFARIAPEKGLHLLARAYRVLRQELGLPPSRLRAAGYMAPEQRAYLRGIEDELRGWGLQGEFHYEGEVDRLGKIAFLRGIDVLSVPSPYAEPKGLYLLEAMANGVPWVQPRHGAFVEIHRHTGGGLLFAPHDERDLAAQVLALAQDPAQAAELGRRGAEGVRAHYSAARMAERALEVYTGVVSRARVAVA